MLRIAVLVLAASGAVASEPSPARPSVNETLLNFRGLYLDAASRSGAQSRAVHLAVLASQGRRPVRLNWRDPPGEGDSSAVERDRFAWLTMPAGASARSLSPFVADPTRWSRSYEAAAASSTCVCTGGGISPGRVPDGFVLFGTQLEVERTGLPLEDLALSWGRSCSTAAIDYTIHEGSLGSWSSHRAIVCSTGDVLRRSITSDSGSRYYLVVPRTLMTEGSYGARSDGTERPRSSPACLPVALVQQCP